MPERNHEVIIDGFVFPDTVTVTLANDEYIDSRDYIDKELYESVSSANDYWQAENAKLRELVRAAWRCIHTGASCSDCRLIAGGCTLQTAMRELGVEVDK